MDNYSSYGDNPYRYPPPQHQHQPPPHLQDPYPPTPPSPVAHPLQYPYNPSYSFSYPQQQQLPPEYQTHSGPLDYQYLYPSPPHSGRPQYPSSQYPYPYSNQYVNSPPPPPPASQISPQASLTHHSSFQYGSVSCYQGHEYSSPSTRPPSRANSFSGYSSPSHDGVGGVSPAHNSMYPPLDNLLGSMRLNDQQYPPSAPAYPSPSPSVLSGPSLSSSSQSLNARYGNRIGMLAYSSNSFSSVEGSMYSQSSLQIVPVKPSKASLKVLLLHGNLDIWVCEAKNLPNMDMFHRTITDMFGKKLPGNVANKIEGKIQRKITSDPYVSISVSAAVIGRTFVISNSENPSWMQHFNVSVAHYAAEVEFLVKDSDVVGSELIGVVAIPIEQLDSGAKIEGFFPILNSSGKPCKPGAELRISIQYTPIEQLSSYHHGVGSGLDCNGVPDTYFPLRRGGKVTLYQDAHVPDGCLPALRLDNGMHYTHGQCWRDIMDAISQARRLIYITGWSVYHKVRLVRDAGYASDCTLGDLLKSKSQEGVRVLLLVWDDPTSRNILGYNTDGLMATHDEETRRFFKHSSVQVLLCPRVAGKRHSWMKQQETGKIYTHHQKTVIVDADAGSNRRKIISFVGGLDLCDGRYDTPKHQLFKTLQTLHKDDFHNPTFAAPVDGCPREPWHDLHSRIDGPAAYDILTNFEERWLKASKRHGIKKLKRSNDDALLRIERIPDIVGMLEAQSINESDPEDWHVQVCTLFCGLLKQLKVFRSIDSNSVKGFPKDPKDATIKNLVCGKNVLIDMSIHTAYVKAIRSAQHFIYIENQYFLGSSYNWTQYKDLGANNLIPMEIALKIANKIRANERFAVYVVIPMWPEGVPTGIATQRILFWQNKTMQMMYETIYKALEEVGLENTYVPEDYLNFFCLGNREAPDGTELSFGESPTASNTPHIYGYRMSLWAEHTGFLEDIFTVPESLECVRRVRSLGESNWRQFAAEDVSEMRGHLLKYPVEVDPRGKVKPIPGCESFPDVGGTIVGTFSGLQENLTI
ncbi:hypothetical protein GIB67_019187 [Kingdonia uniflora]|uniref:phospholipase D n=1 Tax=Kingdonia uniflora TaxID=39325 RepID=A0A7J7N0F1_9MAGN|nr:hypothetical protein GIB67_019187 [Kingdonia uniflora]